MTKPLVVASLLFAFGCSKGSDGEVKPTQTDTKRVDTKKVTTPDNNAPPKQKAATRADAQRVLDAWLRAQNEGDFELYKSLYAKKLTGIKRVHDRKKTFDRNGWLKDRQRIFRKKVVVKAADVKLNVDAKPPTIEFVQTWSSGTFKDVGPKRLTLVDEGGHLRVAREEMLASKVEYSHNKAKGDTDAIDKLIAKTKPETFEIGMPGMNGEARRYKVDGKIVKVWENISADHHDQSITIYYKNEKPFYLSFDNTTGEDVDWDESGGTAAKSRYIFREFLLSETKITDAWERDKTFDGEYPDGASDELMAMKPQNLQGATGGGAHFNAITILAEYYRTATSNNDESFEKYENARSPFSELDD